MHPLLNTAIRAARDASSIIIRYIDRIDTLDVTSKARNDFVTEVDRMAEEVIIKRLRKAYPDHGFLGEESGLIKGNEFQWIIDPLDGTTNFLRGIPHYAISIALKNKDRIEQAVIYDPVKDELFTASLGNGAMMNDRRIRVSKRTTLDGALLGTGIPFRDDQDVDQFMTSLAGFIPGSSGIRRAGSAALDMAYVAAGRLDGYWEYGVKPWDIAAGILMVKEAGGLTGDMTNTQTQLTSGNIVAATPKVYTAMQNKFSDLAK